MRGAAAGQVQGQTDESLSLASPDRTIPGTRREVAIPFPPYLNIFQNLYFVDIAVSSRHDRVATQHPVPTCATAGLQRVGNQRTFSRQPYASTISLRLRAAEPCRCRSGKLQARLATTLGMRDS